MELVVTPWGMPRRWRRPSAVWLGGEVAYRGNRCGETWAARWVDLNRATFPLKVSEQLVRTPAFMPSR